MLVFRQSEHNPRQLTCRGMQSGYLISNVNRCQIGYLARGGMSKSSKVEFDEKKIKREG